ncbi:MAG TPA: AmmeMemoRadiSam system protein A [Steroidobacter sp.]|nr:AmmeMemoRadiSam system protein A [Steroidobacter sp.]
MTLDASHRRQLLELARASINAALRRGSYLAPQIKGAGCELLERRSSFVTLRLNGELRGCTGTLEASRTLAEDVWRNAYGSAFADPRFAPLTVEEWRMSDLHISVLTAPQLMSVANERDLIAQLRIDVDGLILQLGAARATFLPSVWRQIADPASFVRCLKLKAGWPADFWSPQIRVFRYCSESFEEQD